MPRVIGPVARSPRAGPRTSDEARTAAALARVDVPNLTTAAIRPSELRATSFTLSFALNSQPLGAIPRHSGSYEYGEISRPFSHY